MLLNDEEIKKIHNFNLPISNDKRVVIEIVKIDKTPTKYPRKVGVPKKKTL